MSKEVNKGSIKEVIKNHKKELMIGGACLIAGSLSGMIKCKPSKRDQAVLNMIHHFTDDKKLDVPFDVMLRKAGIGANMASVYQFKEGVTMKRVMEILNEDFKDNLDLPITGLTLFEFEAK